MVARTVGRSEQGRRDRRFAILQAAIALFARKGFAGTGISDIARAAGVSHGTVFLYFPSKEALFHAAVLEPLQEFAARSVDIVDGDGAPAERIRRLVREQVRGIAAERSYLQMVQAAIAQGEQFGDLTGEIGIIVDRVVVGLSELIATGIEAGALAPGSPIAIAASYIAYLNGIGLVILTTEDNPIWEDLIEQGLRLFAFTNGDHNDD
jgi:AcrR family transcriptional regulator